MRILYEDNHIIVVYKSSSEIVQGDKSGDVPLSDMVARYLKERYNKPGNVFVGVVHRLDRPVSGVVLFAKTGKALSRMNALFQQRGVDKRYLAIVKNRPKLEEAELVHYLVRNEERNRSYAYNKEVPNSKRAILRYRLVASSMNYHLLQIELLTGRHHQIRCQLSKEGMPIKGDLKYGAERSNPDGSISLHAHYLQFEHPVSHKIVLVSAPLPNDNLWNHFRDAAHSLLPETPM